MKRSAFAAAATLAAALAFGVSAAVAAPLPGSPLAKVAAHDGVSIPPLLAHAITRKLDVAPAIASAGASQAPSQQQKLPAPDGMPGDLFGVTVSLSADGHTALVGAPSGRLEPRTFLSSREANGRFSRSSNPHGSPGDGYGSRWRSPPMARPRLSVT